MGKVKTSLVRRITKELVEKGIVFSDNFEKNKEILRDVIKSKKIRNKVAGLLVRVYKQK